MIKTDRTIDTLLPGHGCTFDILTLFYNARNMDLEALEAGVNNPVSFAIDEEIFDIYFRYIGREEKRIPGLGVCRTLKFAAKVVAGEVFSGEQEMLIWVSDDMNRVPLLFESPIIVGSVFGRLSAWDGLRYPLEECKVTKIKGNETTGDSNKACRKGTFSNFSPDKGRDICPDSMRRLSGKGRMRGLFRREPHHHSTPSG